MGRGLRLLFNRGGGHSAFRCFHQARIRSLLHFANWNHWCVRLSGFKRIEGRLLGFVLRLILARLILMLMVWLMLWLILLLSAVLGRIVRLVLLLLCLLRVVLLLPFALFAHRFAQQTRVMLGMLLEIFGGHAVARQLCVARQHLIFFDDLLRRSPHFTFRSRAVENTVDHTGGWSAVLILILVLVLVFVPRTHFVWSSHKFVFLPALGRSQGVTCLWRSVVLKSPKFGFRERPAGEIPRKINHPLIKTYTVRF